MKTEQNPDIFLLIMFTMYIWHHIHEKKSKIIYDLLIALPCNKEWKLNILEKISCFIAINVTFQV